MQTAGPHHADDSLATRATLLLRLRPGAPGREMAWAEFHDRYAPMIAGFARKMNVLEQDIADLVQDVLAGFYSASPTFHYDPTRGRFRGYLKTCVWHAVRKRLGDRLRWAGRRAAEIDPDDLGVEQVWNDVWETEHLHRAMETVRQRYSAASNSVRTWQAFEMTALLERPPADVADELGLSVDSVHQARTRISRAIRKVLDEMNLGE